MKKNGFFIKQQGWIKISNKNKLGVFDYLSKNVLRLRD